MIVYRIRSRLTGQFSLGGQSVSWSQIGKFWKSIGPLKLHFSGLTRAGKDQYTKHDAEVVEFEIVESIVSSTSVEQWIADVSKRKSEREAADKIRYEAYQKARRRKEFELLQKEFQPEGK